MSALEKYQWLSSCTGMEIHIRPDNSFSCRYCTVSLEKDSLSIDQKQEAEADRTSLFKKVPADKPLAITLTGKGILIKKIAATQEVSSEQLSQYFPNLKAEDFYLQNFQSGNTLYLSIISKQLVDEILQLAEKAGLKILLLSIGPFAVGQVLRQLNSYDHQLVFDGHRILYNKSFEWEEYQYQPGANAEFPIKIGIEPLKEQFLLAYATAFQLALYERLNAAELEVETVKSQLLQFKQDKVFKFRTGALLMLTFLLLLINFLVFNYYNEENAVLLSRVTQNTESTQSLNQLSKDIAMQESLLKKLGWHKGTSYAWISDQLGKSVPAGVSLTELQVNPLNATESNRLRKEVYETGKIKIKGESRELGPVNEWIYGLKELGWCKQVNLDSFSPATEGDNRVFELTLVF